MHWLTKHTLSNKECHTVIYMQSMTWPHYSTTILWRLVSVFFDMHENLLVRPCTMTLLHGRQHAQSKWRLQHGSTISDRVRLTQTVQSRFKLSTKEPFLENFLTIDGRFNRVTSRVKRCQASWRRNFDWLLTATLEQFLDTLSATVDWRSIII